jgi:hypothetical protein
MCDFILFHLSRIIGICVFFFFAIVAHFIGRVTVAKKQFGYCGVSLMQQHSG